MDLSKLGLPPQNVEIWLTDKPYQKVIPMPSFPNKEYLEPFYYSGIHVSVMEKALSFLSSMTHSVTCLFPHVRPCVRY